LGKKKDESYFKSRSISYRQLFDKNFNLLRPKSNDDSWVTPFNPNTGANFQKNLGFIEGNSWQYTFMLTHDVKGLVNLMGGEKQYLKQLLNVFENDQFDMANEPDIVYPYLFNYIKGEEWRSQQKISELIKKYFSNNPNGLPGNDDTGTMSAWLIYSMIGIYPISPADPIYTIVAPSFDKITIKLDDRYYKKNQLIIEKVGDGIVKELNVNNKAHKSYFITHKELLNKGNLKIILD
jgi:predicted alpha-1,2-mannosidase